MSATERLNSSVIALLPPKRAEAVRSLAAELSQRAGGWVRGQIILMAFIGTVTFIGLFALGIPYPVALATWASLMEIIPIIGPFLGAIPAILVAFTDSPWLALATAILLRGHSTVGEQHTCTQDYGTRRWPASHPRNGWRAGRRRAVWNTWHRDCRAPRGSDAGAGDAPLRAVAHRSIGDRG